jgi:methionine-rich copper-binding protein CopC
MVLIAVLAVPSMVLAANKLATGEVAVTAETVTIPLEITNQDGLMAMDIPLKFSEGVTLKEVTFNDTRVSYFDLQVADIDNENRTVAIGLITQITAQSKPDLAAGTGTVANLVFEVTDPDVDEVSLETVTMSKPDHELMFIYHEYVDGKVVDQRVEGGDFEPFALALSGTGDDNVPDHFALMQNYPNPFNPTTIIAFDLPVASDYKLTIYNILGQVVNDISGTSDAGTVEVEWDATAFASGVYFYKINAGDFTDTKKMMLVK